MSKPKKPVVKKITINELKTWLDGYCSAHGDGWAPDAVQWAMIKDKIFALKEGVDHQYPSQPQSPPAQYQQAPVFASPQPPFRNTAPPGASFNMPFSEPDPVMPGQFGPSPAVPGQTIKTPSIDTSNGFTKSSFE